MPRRLIGSPVYLLIGIGSAVVGLVPWLLTGSRLPPQNLWATDSVEMPIALLPFSQYFVFLVAALLVIGSAVAGIIARATEPRHPGTAMIAMAGGVLLVQVTAVVQTTVAVAGGLRETSEAGFYRDALVVGSTMAVLLGVGMMLLIARAPRAWALIGLSLAAIAFGSWLGGFRYGGLASLASAYVVQFAPAVLLGTAIAWCGIRSLGRVIAALVGLGMLVVLPSLVTAVSVAVGSRVYARDPARMVEVGGQVFSSALASPGVWAASLGLAVIVAAVGLVGRSLVRRSPSSSEEASISPGP